MEDDPDDPQLIYQSINLAFDVENEIIFANTTIWLASFNDIIPGGYIYLNCRQCKINEIYVNNKLAEYCFNDPLKNLTPSSTTPSYSATEIDSNYRAGLEISRLGELRITIPLELDSNENIIYQNLPTLPSGTPKDVSSRYESIFNISESLKPKTLSNINKTKSDDEDEEDDDNNLLNSIINRQVVKDYGRLLQIKISYTLERKRLVVPSNDPAKSQGPIYSIPAGYCFRKQKEYLSFDSVDHSNSSKAVCAYSISGVKQNKGIYDVDGIRCWLPCIDLPNQRAIYDVTVYYPNNFNVAVCSGTKIYKRNHYIKRSSDNSLNLSALFGTHSKLYSKPSKHSVWYTSTRFFTPNRIPAYTLGFFVGVGEGYKMPLYKCIGKIWVTRSIQDYIANSDNKRKRRDQNDYSNKANNKNVIVNIVNKIDTSLNSTKRIRFSENCEFKDQNDDFEETDGEEYEDICNNSNIYDELVHHSLLGFDVALKYIHKLLGKKYCYENYSQIYIPELNIGDSIAFDGFILIDSKYLHSNKQIYLETPHHLLNLQTYLYSYISSTYPLLHYTDEYLIHGVVGYLFYLYLSMIYGEEEGLYFIKKCYDSVLTLDKFYHCNNDNSCDRQRDGSIGGLTYPETYGNFLLYKGEYLVSKSIIYFHIIENMLGGNESLRKAIQVVIKAPNLSSTHKSPSASPDHNPINTNINDTAESNTESNNQSNASDSNIEDKKEKISNEIPPPTPLYASTTPSHFESYVQQQQQPYVNYRPEENLGDMSPSQSPYVYMQSPNSMSPSNYYYSSYSLMSPQSYSMSGSSSPLWSGSPNMHQYTSYQHIDLTYLNSDCITGEKFLSIIRSNAGVSSGELNDQILLQYIYNSVYNHPLLIKLDLALDPKQEGRPRHMHIMVDSLLNQRKTYTDTIPLKFRIHELKDDRVTEPTIPINGGSTTKVDECAGSNNVVVHTQALYTRPGRTSGKQIKKGLEDKEETAELAPIPFVESNNINNNSYISKLQQFFISHRLLLSIDLFNSDISNVITKNQTNIQKITNNQSSIVLAKNKSYPLKYILVDPFNIYLSDINLGSIADSLLVEQLFLDIDMFDIIRQCHALKGIERSISSTVRNYQNQYHKQNQGNSTSFEKSPNLQFHALFDYLYNNPSSNITNSLPNQISNNNNNTTINIPNQSVFIRIETLLSLLQWHYDRNYLHHVHVEYNHNSILRHSILNKSQYWEGAIILLKFLYDIIIDPITNLPNLKEDTNEGLSYLKRGVLLIVSQIKSSKKNITPIEIIDFYINLLNHFDDVIDNNDNNSMISDCYIRTILLHAISKFTYDSMNINVGIETRNIIETIVKRVYIYLIQEIVSTKTIARLKYNRNDSNFIPNLPYNGMVIASCILCLGEIDRQAIMLGYQSNLTDKIEGSLFPYTIGIVSMIDYAQFFLPNYLSLHHSHRIFPNNNKDIKKIKIEYNSCLNSILVRSTAIEVYLRICAAYYLNYIQKLSESSKKKPQINPTNTTTGTPIAPQTRDCHYLTAIIEVVLMILQHDQSLQVKHNTLYCFLGLFQDYLPRMIASTIPLGYKVYCYGYSDVNGYTQTPLTQYYDTKEIFQNPNSRNLVGGSYRVIQKLGAGMRSFQTGIKKELKKWWKAMTYGSGFDQVSRSLLLTTWIFLYSDTTPRLLFQQQSSSPSTSPTNIPLDSPSWSPIHSPSSISHDKDSVGLFDDGTNYIPKYSLPIVQSPMESYLKVETLLRKGSDFKTALPTKDLGKLNQNKNINLQRKLHTLTQSTNDNSKDTMPEKKKEDSVQQEVVGDDNNTSITIKKETSFNLSGKIRLKL